MKKMPQAERFIKLPEVMNKTGLGRSSIYRKWILAIFPKHSTKQKILYGLKAK